MVRKLKRDDAKLIELLRDPDRRLRMYVYRLSKRRRIRLKPAVYKGEPKRNIPHFLRTKYGSGEFNVMIRRGEVMEFSDRVFIKPSPIALPSAVKPTHVDDERFHVDTAPNEVIDLSSSAVSVDRALPVHADSRERDLRAGRAGPEGSGPTVSPALKPSLSLREARVDSTRSLCEVRVESPVTTHDQTTQEIKFHVDSMDDSEAPLL